MPKQRWIEYSGERWRMSDLAREYGLRPQTLAGRLERGYPLERALATGLCSLREAGRRGSWRWRDERPKASHKKPFGVLALRLQGNRSNGQIRSIRS